MLYSKNSLLKSCLIKTAHQTELWHTEQTMPACFGYQGQWFPHHWSFKSLDTYQVAVKIGLQVKMNTLYI